MNKIKVDKNSESSILSISVMPYYGCALYGEDGYVLIPDGSGALMENSFMQREKKQVLELKRKEKLLFLPILKR